MLQFMKSFFFLTINLFIHLKDSIAWGVRSSRSTSNPKMLMQFRDSLRASLIQMPRSSDPENPQESDIRARIQELLDKPDWRSQEKNWLQPSRNNLFTWNDAYQVEKLLAHLRPEESLKFEIVKQISSLQKIDPEAMTPLQKAYQNIQERAADAETSAAEKAKLVPEMQNLLERILNDVHWKYAQR